MHPEAHHATITATPSHLRPVVPRGRPPLAPRSPAKGALPRHRQRALSHSTSSSDDGDMLVLPLPDAAVRLEPETTTTRPRTRVVKVATDDPSVLDTQWIRDRVVKLRLALSQLASGSVAHGRLTDQHDRLRAELAKRGTPL